MRTLVTLLAIVSLSGCCPEEGLLLGGGLETGVKTSSTESYDFGEGGGSSGTDYESETGFGFLALLGLMFCDPSEFAHVHVDPMQGRPVSRLASSRLLSSATSAYLLTAYNRFSFDGGHDSLLRLGVQARHRLGPEDGRIWLGGEVSWIRDTTVYDESDFYSDNPSATGFTISPLVGYRLPLRTVDINFFTGIGLIHFGDFESDGNVVDDGGNSLHIRAGVELMRPLSVFGSRKR
jgi:hypothetical protein